jgi:hypothetical protein
MVEKINFNTHTELAIGLTDLVNQLDKSLQLKEPLKMYIAGGMAVHLYTAARVTTDVDAEFSKRFIVPGDLLVETTTGNMLYLDANYNSTFALMHEDYLDDAVRVPMDTDHIEVFVLSPVDLVVSKIARLSGPDMGDIQSLIWTLKITADEIQKRAEEAMHGYIGNMSALQLNLKEVLSVAQKWEEIHAPDPADDDDAENDRSNSPRP